MRTLIQGATVITLSQQHEAPGARDILVEGDRIVAIGVNLPVEDADIIAGAGYIVIPGLVNAHMHTWQSALRGIASNWSLMEYLSHVHLRLAPRYTPDDVYLGTLAGALNQIACGTTTLADWSHNTPTPDHVDAGVAALREAGIRGVFLPTTPRSAAGANPPHPTELSYSREHLQRLLRGPFSDQDGLLGLGMAVYGPHYAPADVALADFRLAREFGLVISMHHSGGAPRSPDAWDQVVSENLLGPNVNIVHGNHIADDFLKRLVDSGVSFTVTPEVEMGDGHGLPISGRLRDLGAMPSLGIDIESAISGEMLIAARIALACQRLQDDISRQRSTDLMRPTLSSRDALAWATVGGARALGLAHKIGTLEPGKQADLVMINARTHNLWPTHDPVATAMQASLSNIEAVMIAGRWRKRAGRLLHPRVESLFDALAQSAERIMREANAPSSGTAAE